MRIIGGLYNLHRKRFNCKSALSPGGIFLSRRGYSGNSPSRRRICVSPKIRHARTCSVLTGSQRHFFSKKTGQSPFPDFLSGKTGLYYTRNTVRKTQGKDESAMKKRLLMISAAAALLLAGCNDYVGKEKSHPCLSRQARRKAPGRIARLPDAMRNSC